MKLNFDCPIYNLLNRVVQSPHYLAPTDFGIFGFGKLLDYKDRNTDVKGQGDQKLLCLIHAYQLSGMFSTRRSAKNKKIESVIKSVLDKNAILGQRNKLFGPTRPKLVIFFIIVKCLRCSGIKM